jgi:hypothetical protein
MHLILALVSVIAVWYRGDYRNWRKYYTTMQFIAIGNLTYNFLCASHWLWRLSPDAIKWFNHTLLEMSYTFITFPATALMFLSRYPEGQGKWRIFRHYAFWIVLYVAAEIILLFKDSILYKYGWSLLWSAAFDCIMFPFLRLHHKRPLLTILISVPFTIFLLWLFDIPVYVPIENR